MIKLTNNYIRENIENLKETHGYQYGSLTNVILYNVTKKYGSDRELVILEGIDIFNEREREYLFSFGIIAEEDIERASSGNIEFNSVLMLRE